MSLSSTRCRLQRTAISHASALFAASMFAAPTMAENQPRDTAEVTA